jgi:hypothetical protein
MMITHIKGRGQGMDEFSVHRTNAVQQPHNKRMAESNARNELRSISPEIMLTVAWYLLRHYHRTTNDLKQESEICVLHNESKKIKNILISCRGQQSNHENRGNSCSLMRSKREMMMETSHSGSPAASIDRIRIQALFSFSKILQNFSDSSSHRIFRRMHGVLNIDENKN